MNYICNNSKNKSVCEALQKLPLNPRTFPFYPFTNEQGFELAIPIIRKLQRLNTTQTLIAILTGESNLVSLLPELAMQVDIILCNDINQQVNLHTQIQIECLHLSRTLDEFKDHYRDRCVQIGIKIDEIDEHIQAMQQALGDEYFLSCPKRFQACKLAAQHLSFVWTQIDLANPEEVQSLFGIFTQHVVQPAFINISNIHHYTDCNALRDNIQLLVQGSNQCVMMFSCGISAQDKGVLRTRVVQPTNLYFQFLADTQANAHIPADIIGIRTASVFEHIRLKGLIDNANKRTQTLIHKHYGLPACEAPKIIIKNKGVIRFFSLEKPELPHQKDWLFLMIAAQLLPVFSIKWFLTSNDITRHTSVDISFSFLLNFIRNTQYLEDESATPKLANNV